MIYILFLCVFLACHRGALAAESASCLACGGNGEYGNAVYIPHEHTGSQFCFDSAGEYQNYDATAPPRCHSKGADGMYHLRCVCAVPTVAASGNVKCRTCEEENGHLLFTVSTFSNRFYCLEPDTRDRRTTASSGTECAVDVGYFGDPSHPLYNRRIVNVVGDKRVVCEC